METSSIGKRSKRAESSVTSSPLLKNKRQIKLERKMKDQDSSPDSRSMQQIKLEINKNKNAMESYN